MSIRLDEVNKRIIHALMDDARNTSAPMIAEEVGVSPATIRNRISQLEDAGVIDGYHANVDFEAADDRLTVCFICQAPIDDRERLTQQVRTVQGVINVRELMAGGANLHVLAVGEDSAALDNVARELVSIGLVIERESLVRSDQYQSYQPFGPAQTQQKFSDFISLTGGNEVVEVSVPDDAPIAGLTLERAGMTDVLADGVLIVSIERDDEVLTPTGTTEIRPGDLLTVLSRDGISESMLDAFESG